MADVPPLLNEIFIIFALSIIVIFIFTRLRIPTIVGFILTGILAGPHGFGLIGAGQEVEQLAEIGIILLLFTIGLEFSLQNLARIKRVVILGGSLQVMLTFLATFLIVLGFGLHMGQAIFMGFLISLSSTAIVLKLIHDRSEVDTPHGYTTLGILIFQDIIVIPMMLLTPVLAGSSADNTSVLLLTLLFQGIFVIIFVIVGARWIVPRILYYVAKTRNRELFLLTILVIGLCVAWLTSIIGLSLALGAFLAGLMISESEYGYQVLDFILPLRDVFMSFFFVSIGMLVDVSFILQNPMLIVLVLIGVLVVKTFIASFTTMLLGFPLRTAVLVGLALSQVGEFSFILSKSGVEYGLLSNELYQLFLAVSVITMAFTPFIIGASDRISDRVVQLQIPDRLKVGLRSTKDIVGLAEKNQLTDHLVIIGFGIIGKNIARAAAAVKIPYAIIEMNPETVTREREKGQPIFYGDATQESVLERARIKNARIVVVAVSDPIAARRITELVRRMSPATYTIVRTRYITELKPLYDLGAHEVIPEEFETSIEIFNRVLTEYLVPRDEIEKLTAEIRADNYEMFRSLSKGAPSLFDLKRHIPEIDIGTFRIEENAPAAGKTLAQINLRKKYGVSLLAISRSAENVSIPDGNVQLLHGDLVILIGLPEKIAEAAHLFRNPEANKSGKDE